MDSKASRRIVWSDTAVDARTVTARLVSPSNPISPECVTDLYQRQAA